MAERISSVSTNGVCSIHDYKSPPNKCQRVQQWIPCPRTIWAWQQGNSVMKQSDEQGALWMSIKLTVRLKQGVQSTIKVYSYPFPVPINT